MHKTTNINNNKIHSLDIAHIFALSNKKRKSMKHNIVELQTNWMNII